MPEIFYSTGAHEDASPHELLFFCPEKGRKSAKMQKTGMKIMGPMSPMGPMGNKGLFPVGTFLS